MAKHKKLTIKNHRQEAALFTRRSIAAFVFVIVFLLCIFIRLYYLQVNEHTMYSTLSRQNLMYVIPVEPNRGLIFDRNGVLLAKNIPVYSLDIIPERVKNMSALLQLLPKIITITPKEIRLFKHSLREFRPFQPVPLKLKLTQQQVAKIYINNYRLPGVSIQTHMMRYYPRGKSVANAVGYVGRINPQELQKVSATNYSPSDDIGKVGIEKYYETALHGKVGAVEAEVNASGHIVRILKRTPATPGNNIYLTLDAKLQAYGEKLLDKNDGAIVAIQPNTGEILALVTKPNYDPNLFVNGLSTADYQKLLHAPGNPLYDRAIRGLYAPGSTIKPFFAVGGLNDGVITPNYTIYDPGHFQLPNTKHIYHDWKYNGHGWVNLNKAIMVSCDTYFYNLAANSGIDRMDQTLDMFGFGTITGLDMPEELPGNVPTPQWKMGARGKPWYEGDAIVTGIGQGYLLATPLQLAVATATLAEHGKRYIPHLLLRSILPNGEAVLKQPIADKPIVLHNSKIWRTVIRAMEDVVRNPHGTAVYFGRHPGYSVAAKTGTAQVYGKQRDEERSRTNIPKRLRNNHLFIMFAPVKNPKIAVAIVVEHASYADEAARKFTDFYFNELKQENLQDQTAQASKVTLPAPS